MSAGESNIESLSQRELRNESGRVLRAVSEGKSFVVTNNGVPVGRLVPLDAPSSALRIVRSAKRRGGWSTLIPRSTPKDRAMREIVDDLREERV